MYVVWRQGDRTCSGITLPVRDKGSSAVRADWGVNLVVITSVPPRSCSRVWADRVRVAPGAASWLPELEGSGRRGRLVAVPTLGTGAGHAGQVVAVGTVGERGALEPPLVA